MEHKKIYTIDMIIVVGTIIILGLLVGYSTPLVISPINNASSTSSEILFTIKNANILLIDDNIGFASPEEYKIVDGLKIRLEPGVYYWKAVSILQSVTRTLTIESSVILEFRQDKDGYSIVNAGSEILNVEVYNQTELIDQLELTPQQKKEVDGTKVIGAMK